MPPDDVSISFIHVPYCGIYVITAPAKHYICDYHEEETHHSTFAPRRALSPCAAPRGAGRRIRRIPDAGNQDGVFTEIRRCGLCRRRRGLSPPRHLSPQREEGELPGCRPHLRQRVVQQQFQGNGRPRHHLPGSARCGLCRGDPQPPLKFRREVPRPD